LWLGVGLCVWPLVEYSIHRWLFHACPPSASRLLITLHFGVHGLHHKAPFDTRRLLFPPAPALSLAALAYLVVRTASSASLAAAVAAPLATAVLAGALTGFLGYDLTHFYLHTGSPAPGSRLYRLKRRHNQHHFAQFDRGNY
ncbi:fatty acid 2-hydroxylase-like, partial [Nilaparvata lugens]|uniref:fatty acid 2-hydroxylase-like n=1 Tax=Nilaparvata lugens TaxID=108931 RepID=UPI00193D0642